MLAGSQQCAEQMAGAEDIERQVAVAPVAAVKEAVLLLAVEGIVGGVEIEDDLIGRLRVGLGERFDQQGLQGLGVMVDLVVAVGAIAGGKFESVEGALARQGKPSHCCALSLRTRPSVDRDGVGRGR